jgi:hypothetical protein
LIKVDQKPSTNNSAKKQTQTTGVQNQSKTSQQHLQIAKQRRISKLSSKMLRGSNRFASVD